MRKPEQDSFDGRRARGNKYVSLASMSVLVVIIGMLLTFALPRVLPEGTKPAGTLTPAPLLETDIPTPTPTPAPRVYQLALGTGGALAKISTPRTTWQSLAWPGEQRWWMLKASPCPPSP